MSEVICHALRRTDQLNTGDQLAIGQEYREWIQCVKNRELIPQDFLFINTSTFGKKFQQRDRVVTYTERGLPHLYRGEKMQIVKLRKQLFIQVKTSPSKDLEKASSKKEKDETHQAIAYWKKDMRKALDKCDKEFNIVNNWIKKTKKSTKLKRKQLHICLLISDQKKAISLAIGAIGVCREP